MRSKRLTIIIGLLSMALLIAAACSSDAPEGPRDPTQEFNPTPAGGAAPTATTAPDAPAATTAPEPTQAPPASTGPAGDAGNGKILFAANSVLACSGCHSTGTFKRFGPGLAGVLEQAASRVEGMSAEEYIEQSIRDPAAFVVSDFPNNLMPTSYGSLPDSDIQDLVAYLSTLN